TAGQSPVGRVGAIQVIPVRRKIDGGSERRADQGVGVEGVRDRRVHLVQPLRVRGDEADPKRVGGFRVFRLDVYPVLDQCAVREQFLEQRHKDVLTQQLYRVV